MHRVRMRIVKNSSSYSARDSTTILRLLRDIRDFTYTRTYKLISFAARRSDFHDYENVAEVTSPEYIGIPNEFRAKLDRSSDFHVCQKHTHARARTRAPRRNAIEREGR